MQALADAVEASALIVSRANLVLCIDGYRVPIEYYSSTLGELEVPRVATIRVFVDVGSGRLVSWGDHFSRARRGVGVSWREFLSPRASFFLCTHSKHWRPSRGWHARGILGVPAGEQPPLSSVRVVLNGEARHTTLLIPSS